MADITNDIFDSIAPLDQELNGVRLDTRDLTLDNGLRVLLTPMDRATSVGISLYVKAGSRYELTESDSGLSHFLEHLCFKGTLQRPDPVEISKELDQLGGGVNAITDRELTVYYGKMTPDAASHGLALLSDLIQNSILLDDEIERERGVILEELAAVEDSPPELVSVALDGLIWPNQPHGREIAGTVSSVTNMPREKIVSYYKQQYVPNAATLSIAGAFDPASAERAVNELYGGWQSGSPGQFIPDMPVSRAETDGDLNLANRLALIQRDTEQVHLMLGMPGLALHDERRYALELFSVILGEGMSSRLFVRLREKLGLCYDIHSYPSFLTDTGMFGIYSGVDPKNVDATIEELFNELERAVEMPTESEVRLAKQIIRSRLTLRLEDSRAVSSYVGAQVTLGLPTLQPDELLSKIDSIDRASIGEVAELILKPSRYHLSAIGPVERDRLANHLALG
tara:strand:+ start:1740 stop:3104 length:1365 start_codon:yes stop_codon:yes gene_type:complete